MGSKNLHVLQFFTIIRRIATPSRNFARLLKKKKSAGLPACVEVVLVIHLMIVLASPIDCFCADLCFACIAPAGYSLSVAAWYTLR